MARSCQHIAACCCYGIIFGVMSLNRGRDAEDSGTAVIVSRNKYKKQIKILGGGRAAVV